MKMQCWFAVKGKETSARTKGQTEPVAIAENKNSTRFHWDIWRGLQRLSLNFSFAKMERKSSLFLRQGMENIHCVSSFLQENFFEGKKYRGIVLTVVRLLATLYPAAVSYELLLLLLPLPHNGKKGAHSMQNYFYIFLPCAILTTVLLFEKLSLFCGKNVHNWLIIR